MYYEMAKKYPVLRSLYEMAKKYPRFIIYTKKYCTTNANPQHPRYNTRKQPETKFTFITHDCKNLTSFKTTYMELMPYCMCYKFDLEKFLFPGVPSMVLSFKAATLNQALILIFWKVKYSRDLFP